MLSRKGLIIEDVIGCTRKYKLIKDEALGCVQTEQLILCGFSTTAVMMSEGPPWNILCAFVFRDLSLINNGQEKPTSIDFYYGNRFASTSPVQWKNNKPEGRKWTPFH